MNEQEQCWTGVTLVYLCPTCHRQDRQLFVFEGGTYGIEPLRKAAACMMPCTHCNSRLPKNLEIETDTVVVNSRVKSKYSC
jgi:hypothetical protein